MGNNFIHIHIFRIDGIHIDIIIIDIISNVKSSIFLLENTKIYSIDIEIVGGYVMPIPHGYINILMESLF